MSEVLVQFVSKFRNVLAWLIFTLKFDLPGAVDAAVRLPCVTGQDTTALVFFEFNCGLKNIDFFNSFLIL